MRARRVMNSSGELGDTPELPGTWSVRFNGRILVAQSTVVCGATTSLMNSSRVAISRNTPRTAEVTSRAS